MIDDAELYSFIRACETVLQVLDKGSFLHALWLKDLECNLICCTRGALSLLRLYQRERKIDDYAMQ
jgi:hypothetical protein